MPLNANGRLGTPARIPEAAATTTPTESTSDPTHPLGGLLVTKVIRYPRRTGHRRWIELHFQWRGELHVINGVTGREMIDYTAFRRAAAEVGAYGLPAIGREFGFNQLLEQKVAQATQVWL